MTFMIVSVIVVGAIALIATLIVGKQVSQQIKEYEEEEVTAEDELQRSLEYEKKSISGNLKPLTWIYIALALATIFVCLGIYFA